MQLIPRPVFTGETMLCSSSKAKDREDFISSGTYIDDALSQLMKQIDTLAHIEST
jgi:hypothetical protein